MSETQTSQAAPTPAWPAYYEDEAKPGTSSKVVGFSSRSNPVQEARLFSPVLRLFAIGFLFVTALGIRLYHINEPPLDFHPTRQYHSAIIARGYYYETLDSIPEWKKQVARINKQRMAFVEPRIMELAASYAYRILGAENLWIPRVLSSIFWLIGGGFLYLIAKAIVSADAAVLSTAFYLFLPFGVFASRSFQPDPMMVMMLLFSIFAILRYHDQPSWPGLVMAAIVSALALFIKPGICLFPIFGAFVALAAYRSGIRRLVTSPDLLVFAAISLSLIIAYYVHGTFITGSLRGSIQGRFLPHLLLQPFFWNGWLNLIGSVVGYTAVVGALIGLLMSREGLPRALLIGLWAGYILFGLVFTYHIHTHDYYQLPLIPVVALSLGPIGALIVDRLSQTCTRWHWRVAALGILLLPLLLSIRETRWRLIHPGFEREVRIAQEIGEAVAHSTKTIFLTSHYGKPLQYYGELSGINWPQSADLWAYKLRGLPEMSAEERFASLSLNYSPEYFIVTDFREFEAQKGLKGFLTENYPIAVQNASYLIFDLRKSAALDKPPEKH